MTTHEHKIGFTYSQLLTAIGLLGAIISVWVSVNVQIAEIRENNKNFRAEYNQQKIVYEQQRIEQREDMKTLSGKIDEFIKIKSN